MNKVRNLIINHYWLFFSLILVLAFLLRLPLLNGSFWLDEAAQVLESARPLTLQLQIAHDFQPPLMHLVVHFALYLGKSEAWLRFVGTLIPGLITIAGLMLVIKKLDSPLALLGRMTRVVSLLAGLLLATNTWHIFYSQELRPYSFPAMFAVLSWLVLIKYLASSIQHPLSKVRSLFIYFSLFIFNLFGLYSSYLYPLLVVSQLAYLTYLWWQQPHQRRLVKISGLTIVISSLFFLPWLPKLSEQLTVSAGLRQSLPTWQEVVSIPQAKGLFLVFAKFIYGVLRVDLNLFWISLSAFLVGLILILFIIKIRQPAWRKLVTPFLFWFLVPVAGAWLISFIIPVLRPKRVLLALPALEAILAFLIVLNTDKLKIKNLRFKSKKSSQKLDSPLASLRLSSSSIGRMTAGVLFVGLLLINVYSYVSYLTKPELEREPWRQAVSQVISSYPENTVAVFVYPNPYSPWRWYAPDDYPTLALGKLSINEVENLDTKLKPATAYRYIITFDYLTDLTDPEHKLNQKLKNLGYKEVKVVAYPNIGFIRIYKK